MIRNGETARRRRRASAALLGHLLTASGAALALLALLAAADGRWTACFAWLGVALVVDALDGPLARWLDVGTRLPAIDGALLDLVVDFTTYVFVPAFVLARAGVLPDPLATPLAAAVVAASALYFADVRMKLPGQWFRGFPALWNGVAFLLVVARPPEAVAAAAVLAAVVGMFLPLPFVHPVRVRALRPFHALAAFVGGAAALASLASDLRPSVPILAALLAASAWLLLAGLFRRGPGKAPAP